MKLRDLGAGLKRLRRFAVDDVWDVELTSLSALRRLGVKAVRVVHLVFKGFQEDECPLHASALTFSTLMSIVPVLALSLAVARGLGDTETAKNWIRQSVSTWTETFRTETAAAPGGSVTNRVAPVSVSSNAVGHVEPDWESGVDLADEIDRLVERGFERVESISFAALSGVGLVILLWTVVQVLGRVEASFNTVWGVKEGRSFWRKFTDYLSMLFVMPLLVIAASSLPAADFATRFLDGQAAQTLQAFLGSGVLKHVMVVLMTTLCFGFFIMFMPNTRVRFRAAFTGGLVAAILFIFWLWLCATLQVGAARAGKIYGSFAIVPIILAWVYVSWQIVLFGAETAFAVQNCTTYRMERGAGDASMQARLVLALSVVVETARAMMGKGGAFDATAFARDKRVAVRFLNDVIADLVDSGLMAELSEREGEYVLLRAPSALKVGQVFETLQDFGVGPAALGLGSIDAAVEKAVARARTGAGASLEEMTVRDLI